MGIALLNPVRCTCHGADAESESLSKIERPETADSSAYVICEVYSGSSPDTPCTVVHERSDAREAWALWLKILSTLTPSDRKETFAINYYGPAAMVDGE